MRSWTWRSLSALCLLGGLTACASDHQTDNVRPERLVEDNEGLGAPKSDAVLRIAHATAARGDWPMAATMYRRAFNFNPENFEAIKGLARSLNELGANDQALEAYEIALDLRKDDAEALRGIGNTLILLDRPGSALPHFERALNQKSDPRVINSMAVAYDTLDDYKAAQACYRVGLDIAPDDIALRNNLGLSLLLSGEYDTAVEELRRVISTPGATTRHRLNLALALVLADDAQTAEGVARFDLDPAAAREQIAYFETIKALGDANDTRAVLRAHFRGNGQAYMKKLMAGGKLHTEKKTPSP